MGYWKEKFLKVRKKVVEHKTLVNNFSSLSILQGVNILLSLIIYPYLIKVLGSEQYGLVVFAQIIVGYFGVFVSYGFKISATKDISIHRDDKQELSEIVSSVLGVKLILWLVSLLILSVLVATIPQLKEEKLLFLFSFGGVFMALLFPHWYFQGVEKMKYITIFNLLSRVLFLLLLVVFVQGERDYVYVPIFQGVGAFVAGSLGLYVVVVKEGIALKMQSASKLRDRFVKSSALFGSDFITSIKNNFSVVLIGTFLGMKEVAIYDLVIKLFNVFKQFINTVNSSIYPKMAKEKNMKLMVIITRYVFVIVTVVLLVLQPFLSPLIGFFGESMKAAVTPAKILLLTPLVYVWSTAYGQNCLLVFGKESVYMAGIFLTSLFYLLLVGLAFFFDSLDNLYVFILIVPLVHLFELIYRYLAVKYLKLL